VNSRRTASTPVLLGQGEGVADCGEPQVGKAGHLQVRPADVAGEGGAFAQVTLAVGQPQRRGVTDGSGQVTKIRLFLAFLACCSRRMRLVSARPDLDRRMAVKRSDA
jgi:hypothetical protein